MIRFFPSLHPSSLSLSLPPSLYLSPSLPLSLSLSLSLSLPLSLSLLPLSLSLFLSLFLSLSLSLSLPLSPSLSPSLLPLSLSHSLSSLSLFSLSFSLSLPLSLFLSLFLSFSLSLSLPPSLSLLSPLSLSLSFSVWLISTDTSVGICRNQLNQWYQIYFNPLRTQHTWICVKPHIRLLAGIDAFRTMQTCLYTVKCQNLPKHFQMYTGTFFQMYTGTFLLLCLPKAGSEGLWEGIATKKCPCTFENVVDSALKACCLVEVAQGHSCCEPLRGWFWSTFYFVSWFFYNRICLPNEIPFKKCAGLSYKLWTTKKLWQKPRKRQICMETGVSVKG